MINIAFLVHTPYHLLLTTSIILDHFNDHVKYNITIIQAYKGNKKTLGLGSINGTLSSIDISLKNGLLPTETVSYVNDLIKTKYKLFFNFNEDDLLSIYLSLKLRSDGTKICLVQDGLKAYAVINKVALRYRFLRTLEFYKFIYNNKLRLTSFHFVNIKYGQARFVDEVWITHPEATIVNNKEIRKINIYEKEEHFKVARKAFNFLVDNLDSDNAIFFVSSVVHNNLQVYEVEKSIIEHLRKKYPEKTFYLKVHPRVPEKILDLFSALEGIHIINDYKPAELYVSCLYNSIIIGSYSTALLYNNVNCNYFWLYPLYKDYIKTFTYTTLINPTKHIRIIANIEEL